MNGVATLPGASVTGAVVCPYASVVPNWNDTLIGAPSGFTVPLTVAAEVETPLAAPVTGVPGW